MARVGAAQPRARLIDYRLRSADEVLARVDRSLDELAGIVRRAGDLGCDAVALPEDALGLGHWMAGNAERLSEVLPEAVRRMQERLGEAAAARGLYLLCCSDTLEADGFVRNTAFFFGRDGREIGRYHKVNLPVHEQYKTPGDHFPVFDTPDLGGVGMLICYDMVFPEAVRIANGALTVGEAAFRQADEFLRAGRSEEAATAFTRLIAGYPGSWIERVARERLARLPS